MALSGTITTSKTTAAGSGYPGYLYLKWESVLDPINNRNTMTWKLYGGSDYSDKYKYTLTGPVTVYINGTRVLYITNRFQLKKDVLVDQGTINITHESDGSKDVPITISAAVYQSSINCTYSGSVTINKIDRTAPTVTLTTSNLTQSSISVNATSSTNCNSWDYSINNGNTWTNFSTTNGVSTSTTISGLSPNTSYNLKVRARKTYNHVYGTSSTYSITTPGGTSLNSVNTVIADTPTTSIYFTVTIYNTGRTHTLSIKDRSTTILSITNLTLNNGSNSLYLTDSQRTTLLTYMQNMRTLNATFELKTYSGSTQVGSTSTKTAEIRVTHENSAPIFTGYSYRDSNPNTVAITGNDQIFIKDLSILNITPNNATTKNYAGSITSYLATCASSTKSSSTATSFDVGTIDTFGGITTLVSAIDSRGLSTGVSTTLHVLNYTPINIGVNDSYANRLNGADVTIQVNLEGTLNPLTIDDVDKNTVEYLGYRYKKTDEDYPEQYTELQGVTIVSGRTFEFHSNNLCSLDVDYSYYIQFKIQDGFSTDYIEFLIPPGKPLVSYRKKKVGINNINPTSALDVNGEIKMNSYNVLGYVSTVAMNSDFNNYTDSGIYYSNNTASVSHAPGPDSLFLEVLRFSTSYVIQRATTLSTSPKIYLRYYNGSLWGSWRQI